MSSVDLLHFFSSHLLFLLEHLGDNGKLLPSRRRSGVQECLTNSSSPQPAALHEYTYQHKLKCKLHYIQTGVSDKQLNLLHCMQQHTNSCSACTVHTHSAHSQHSAHSSCCTGRNRTLELHLCSHLEHIQNYHLHCMHTQSTVHSVQT